jgi:hypothetical protein
MQKRLNAISWLRVLAFSRFCMNVVYAKNEPLCGSQTTGFFVVFGRLIAYKPIHSEKKYE